MNATQEPGMAYIGKVLKGTKMNKEKQREPVYGDSMYLNLKNAFTGFICGNRGGGKTYTSNVILEEVIEQNPNLGIAVIDNMGIYFSLKYPNNRENELNGWKIAPFGYKDRIRVLIPAGWKDVYDKDHYDYDGLISIKPNQLTFSNWRDIFKWKPSEPQAMLFMVVLEQLKKHWKQTFGPTDPDYSIDDMIKFITEQMHEDDRFNKATINALISRLLGASSWKIFSHDGLDIYDLIKEGIITVIDVSHEALPKEISAILVALMTERIYTIRKTLSVAKMQREIGREIPIGKMIPPTLLVIEEAQNFMGRRKRSDQFSIDPLKHYIKEGRSPGCSLICITQEPKALDDTALSQLDFVLIHQLTYDDDIDSVKRLVPCEYPRNKIKSWIKGLGIGEAFIGKRNGKELKKIKIRPRHSLHLARTETTTIFDLNERKVEILESEDLVDPEFEIQRAKKQAYEEQRKIEVAKEKASKGEAEEEDVEVLQTIIEMKEEEIKTLNIKITTLETEINKLNSSLEVQDKEREQEIAENYKEEVVKLKTQIAKLKEAFSSQTTADDFIDHYTFSKVMDMLFVAKFLIGWGVPQSIKIVTVESKPIVSEAVAPKTDEETMALLEEALKVAKEEEAQKIESQEQLRQLNIKLDVLKNEYTEKIEKANKMLKGFSQSIESRDKKIKNLEEIISKLRFEKSNLIIAASKNPDMKKQKRKKDLVKLEENFKGTSMENIVMSFANRILDTTIETQKILCTVEKNNDSDFTTRQLGYVLDIDERDVLKHLSPLIKGKLVTVKGSKGRTMTIKGNVIEFLKELLRPLEAQYSESDFEKFYYEILNLLETSKIEHDRVQEVVSDAFKR